MKIPGLKTFPPVTAERVIAAPPERIFAVLADPHRHREIDGSGTLRGAVEGPQRLAAGSTFGMKMSQGLPYQMINTVVDYEENRRIAWQPRPTNPLAALAVGGRIWLYELEPVAAGTRVRESWNIGAERFPPAIWLLGGITRRNMVRTLDRLAELTERPEPA